MIGLGSSGAKIMSLGATPAKAAYLGSEKVWRGEQPPNVPYLTFSSSSEFQFLFPRYNSWDGTLEYSTDAQNWQIKQNNDNPGYITAALDGALYKVYMRGTGNTTFHTSSPIFVDYIIGDNIKCEGNIETLLDWQTVKNGQHPRMAEHCFEQIFSYPFNTRLISAPSLPSTELTAYCYYNMFNGCKKLTKAPELPATVTAERCYGGMFTGCSALSEAPDLPATVMSERCYASMFSGCTSLQTAPALNALELAEACYYSMFSGCTSLQTAPDLPATTLQKSCYYNMFGNCSNLVRAGRIDATTTAKDCCTAMFYKCTVLNTLPALKPLYADDGAYRQMFDYCYGLHLYETQTGDLNSYRIPVTGSGTGYTHEDYPNNHFKWNDMMFYRIGTTLPNDPVMNRTYYTSNQIV